MGQNGKEAIDLLQQESFDCVLMDMQMPVLDGFEATRLIRPDALYTTVARWLSARSQQKPFSATSSIPAVESTWAGNPDVIDLAVLAELVGGDKLKMREFAIKFLASVRGDMREIEAALERNDLAALGALGHHVKSSARMTGAIGFANLLSCFGKVWQERRECKTGAGGCQSNARSTGSDQRTNRERVGLISPPFS